MASTTFKYTVRDPAGRVTSGRIEGESREAVTARLRQNGIVLDLAEDRFAQLSRISFGSGVRNKDLTLFARQFATMVNAGLSLTKCLSILSVQSESKALREIVARLGKDVEAGQSLSEAMSKHRKVFPPVFVNMVRAGETGGVLDEVLLRVADLFEQEASLRGRIKSAMTYPIAMGALVLLILIAMLIFVVPTFEKMFADMGGVLPLPTRILVALSDGASSWPGLVFVAVVIGLVVAFRAWTSTESGRYIWDGIKLRVPIVKQIVRKTALARFTRTFGTLVAAGVPILQALDIVADTAGNAVVARAVRKARSAVKEGEMIAKPLGESPVFPSMVVQMISVGEETGALDQMLAKVADFYDEEVANTVDSLTSVIEPVMMATLGGVVGLVVVALYLPMFNVITLIE